MQKFILVDINKELTDAWEAEFSQYKNFEVHRASIFSLSGDAIVSPANSFGFMDGGIDMLYSLNMGWEVQRALQTKIKEKFNGELLIGQATIVATYFDKFPFLICAPTMRVPMVIKGTANVYLASKAMFMLSKEHEELGTIVCPGLGTGTGKVSPESCAKSMRKAYEDHYLGKYQFPARLFDANYHHRHDIGTPPTPIV